MTTRLKKKTVNLALQGGGAHGAFTWGVLDRLLEEERLEIEGVSGTSAGAMNALMLKTGMGKGGRDGAREQLDRFWGTLRHQSTFNRNPLADWIALVSNDAAKIAEATLRSPAYLAQEAFGRAFSPYEWNPLNINPLKDLLEEMIDFGEVCLERVPYLFISATNVRSGKIRVFKDAELSLDVVLASSCLPNLFQAVEIEGEAYWDGGFMGNPALFPLFSHCETEDVVIVHVNPIEREEVPRTGGDIQNRINEISFNSSLLRELRAIAFVKRLIDQGKLKTGEMKDIRVHSVRDDETMAALNVATKLAPEPELFDHLKSAGRAAADGFLSDHWGDLGKRGSLDLTAMLS